MISEWTAEAKALDSLLQLTVFKKKNAELIAVFSVHLLWFLLIVDIVFQ